MAGGLPNHSCQRPLSNYIHRDDDCHLCPMAWFAARGKSGFSTTVEDAIVVILDVSVVSITSQVV